jgi:AraC family transcriptional regulator, regulatory protein of adaptative response / methylated-DNA-[protein]-cysteine methyltransferase
MVSSTISPSATATDLRFAIGECDLGSILVAWSERGISAIDLGDNPATLAVAFHRRFPNAALIEDEPEIESLLSRVARFVENPSVGLDLPLEISGTAFERRVWAALRAIPAGRTASYGEIARVIGAPTAARAAARACAANRIAVAIPCHRVVGHDGALTGYRWGIERKRALLAREAGA